MSSARETAESVGLRLARGLLISRYDERDQKAIAVAGKLIDQAIAAAILTEREACCQIIGVMMQAADDSVERGSDMEEALHAGITGICISLIAAIRARQ